VFQLFIEGCWENLSARRAQSQFSSLRYAEIRRKKMLKLAIIFAIVSVIAGIFGFTGIAAGAAGIAKFLFFLFVAAFIIVLALALLAGKALF